MQVKMIEGNSYLQVRENVGVAVNSESDDHRSIADDNRDETETINLKIKSYNSVEFHVDDDQNEDVCLITETNLSYSGNHGDYTKEESAGKIMKKFSLRIRKLMF